MCDACRNIEQLRLTVVLHHGEVAIKQIKQFEELAGEAVILIHRLLKNSLVAREYIMMTKAFFTLSGGITGAKVETHIEEVEGFYPTQVRVFYPIIDRAFPPQPAPGFPPPDTEFRIIAHRWNDYARKRILGQETRRNFSSLPDKEMTLWDWLDYFVWSDIVSAIHIFWSNLTKKR